MVEDPMLHISLKIRRRSELSVDQILWYRLTLSPSTLSAPSGGPWTIQLFEQHRVCPGLQRVRVGLGL